MKRALIICAGGMSSSLIAKKTTEKIKEQGHEIEVDSTSASQGAKIIEEDKFDLYLVSPQTKMYFDNLEKSAKKKNKPIVNIPPQAYVPIDMGIEKMANLVQENL